MKTIRIYFTCILLCISLFALSQTKGKATIPKVQFIHSPLSDYLYFLFNRKELKAVPQMDSLIGIKALEELDALIALPEILASEGKTDYASIYLLLDKYYKNNRSTEITKPHPKKLSFSDTYPSYDTIKALVQKGEQYYPAFFQVWKEKIEPLELKQIEAWKKQLIELQVLEKFYALTKLSLKTKTLDVAAIAYHMAGSANYSPTGIYTSLFKEPNLPWVIGHEGTHLLLSGPAGANWMSTPKAKTLAKLAESKGETLYEIEEHVCHFLQAMMSKSSGLEPAEYSIHAPYPEGFRRNFLALMEKEWDGYLKSNQTIVDLMISVGEQTLQQMPDKN